MAATRGRSPSPTKLYRCGLCCSDFPTLSDCVQHLTTHSEERNDSVKTPESQEPSPAGQESVQAPVVCRSSSKRACSTVRDPVTDISPSKKVCTTDRHASHPVTHTSSSKGSHTKDRDSNPVVCTSSSKWTDITDRDVSDPEVCRSSSKGACSTESDPSVEEQAPSDSGLQPGWAVLDCDRSKCLTVTEGTGSLVSPPPQPRTIQVQADISGTVSVSLAAASGPVQNIPVNSLASMSEEDVRNSSSTTLLVSGRDSLSSPLCGGDDGESDRSQRAYTSNSCEPSTPRASKKNRSAVDSIGGEVEEDCADGEEGTGPLDSKRDETRTTLRNAVGRPIPQFSQAEKGELPDVADSSHSTDQQTGSQCNSAEGRKKTDSSLNGTGYTLQQTDSHCSQAKGGEQPDQTDSSLCDSQQTDSVCGQVKRDREQVVAQCPVNGCERRFLNITSLKSHINLHKGVQASVKCDRCPASFARPAALHRHYTRHTGQKNYMCSDCGDTFARSDTRAMHMRIHSGETPYMCSACGRMFKDRSYCRRHVAGHDKVANARLVTSEKGTERTAGGGSEGVEIMEKGGRVVEEGVEIIQEGNGVGVGKGVELIEEGGGMVEGVEILMGGGGFKMKGAGGGVGKGEGVDMTEECGMGDRTELMGEGVGRNQKGGGVGMVEAGEGVEMMQQSSEWGEGVEIMKEAGGGDMEEDLAEEGHGRLSAAVEAEPTTGQVVDTHSLTKQEAEAAESVELSRKEEKSPAAESVVLSWKEGEPPEAVAAFCPPVSQTGERGLLTMTVPGGQVAQDSIKIELPDLSLVQGDGTEEVVYQCGDMVIKISRSSVDVEGAVTMDTQDSGDQGCMGWVIDGGSGLVQPSPAVSVFHTEHQYSRFASHGQSDALVEVTVPDVSSHAGSQSTSSVLTLSQPLSECKETVISVVGSEAGGGEEDHANTLQGGEKKQRSPRVGERRWPCPDCSAAFFHRAELKRHQTKHTGEKPYQCNICGKKVRDPSNLRRHIRTHTGERPYSCQVCKKTFRQAGHLTAHMRIHTGQRPYKCHICPAAFIEMNHLRYHQKVHAGIRSHQCPKCELSFIRSHELKRHMQVHNGHSTCHCHLCPATFSRIDSLTQHLLRKHKQKAPFQCGVCSQYFHKQTLLDRHRAVHGHLPDSTSQHSQMSEAKSKAENSVVADALCELAAGRGSGRSVVLTAEVEDKHGAMESEARTLQGGNFELAASQGTGGSVAVVRNSAVEDKPVAASEGRSLRIGGRRSRAGDVVNSRVMARQREEERTLQRVVVDGGSTPTARVVLLQSAPTDSTGGISHLQQKQTPHLVQVAAGGEAGSPLQVIQSSSHLPEEQMPHLVVVEQPHKPHSSCYMIDGSSPTAGLPLAQHPVPASQASSDAVHISHAIGTGTADRLLATPNVKAAHLGEQKPNPRFGAQLFSQGQDSLTGHVNASEQSQQGSDLLCESGQNQHRVNSTSGQLCASEQNQQDPDSMTDQAYMSEGSKQVSRSSKTDCLDRQETISPASQVFVAPLRTRSGRQRKVKVKYSA